MMRRTRIALLVAGTVLLSRGAALGGDFAVGSFAKTTAAAPVTQVVAHGLGQTPKALILWTAGKTNETLGGAYFYGFGMTDGTTSRAVATVAWDDVNHANTSRRLAAKVLTMVEWDEVLLAEADLQSWDAATFTLAWTANDTVAAVVHFVAIGGPGVSAKVVGWTMPTAPGPRAVTGVGFRPDVVLHAHAGVAFTAAPSANLADAAFGLGAMDRHGFQWATTYHSDDPTTKADTQRYQRTNQSIVSIDASQTVRKEAAFVSMDLDGFTVNFTTANAVASQAFSLALGGMWARAGSFTKSTAAAPATQAVGGIPFRPGVVLLASVQDAARTTPVAHARFGIGASAGAAEGSSAFQDTDDLANFTSVDGVDKTSKVFVKLDNNTPSIDAEADLTSLDASGFTLGWTTNDAVATEILYLALRPRRRVVIE
jgi:hypothetical protein